MKTSAYELLIIFAIGFLLFSFIAGSINTLDWGIILRSIYILVCSAVFLINKRYG
jgi:hypothetical protein